MSVMSPALAGGFFTTSVTWEALTQSESESLSRVRLSATPWTVALQSPLSMGFSRQEYWSGFPCPPSGDLPAPGIELACLESPELAGGFFTTELGSIPGLGRSPGEGNGNPLQYSCLENPRVEGPGRL